MIVHISAVVMAAASFVAQRRNLMYGVLFRSRINNNLISVCIFHSQFLYSSSADLLQADTVVDLVVGSIVLRFKLCQLLLHRRNFLG